MSILSDKLQSFDYYKNKLPLYLQNCESFVNQFRMWHDMMMNVVNVSDEILALLNIFDDNYLEYINSLKADPTDTTDILDKLAALFGFDRTITITYYDEDSQLVEETLVLSDESLLKLIKAQVIKSYFEGTRKQINELCEEVLQLPIFYVTDNATSCVCNIALVISSGSSYDYSDEIKKLFLAGLFNLESMGIKYSFAILDLENLLVWDKEISATYSGWDGGVWSL